MEALFAFQKGEIRQKIYITKSSVFHPFLTLFNIFTMQPFTVLHCGLLHYLVNFFPFHIQGPKELVLNGSLK